MTAIVDPDKCTGCESCVDACPLDAIEMQDDIAVVDEETCSDCGSCVDACPAEAITLEE
jgi:NAD-dependent dihydropyrimidine dehydrogenase PreA subunit